MIGSSSAVREDSRCARIRVTVTGAGGVIPISGAEVNFICDTVPGQYREVFKTDENGKTGIFGIPVRRIKRDGSDRYFPGKLKCEIKILAYGFVPCRIKEATFYPGVTTNLCVSLIKKSDSDLFSYTPKKTAACED